MGDISNEGHLWPIEDYLEDGQFPSSSLEWTERNPSNWFEFPQPLCEPEPRLLSPPNAPWLPPPGQSQEGENGDNTFSSFRFKTSSPPTSAACSSVTITNTSTTLLTIHDVTRARADPRSEHGYSRDGECDGPQSREPRGGGAPPNRPNRPITGRAAIGHSAEPPLVIGQHSATQPIPSSLRSTRKGGVIKRSLPPDFVRMSKTGLKACHMEEVQPEILLKRAMKRVAGVSIIFKIRVFYKA